MRGTNRPGERNASGVARHSAIARIVLVLAALMSMMLLSTACSKDSATSVCAGSQELEEALANGKPTLAGFVGDDCCQTITPALEELVVEYDGTYNILILEVGERKSLFEQYGITLTPTQVYFDSSGAEVERIVGRSTKEEMVDRLAATGVSLR